MGITKKRISQILDLMDATYGTDIVCYLEYKEPWQLLFATILSAQCTDARVNMVTKDLFAKYTSLEDFASADISELEEDIRSTGFYHNKAKNIKACAISLIKDHDGILPSDIDELTKLPGVGRKTANVVRTHIFHEPSVVVDTHVGRIARRLGFTEEKDPVKVEFALMKAVPLDHWSLINFQFIAHGRSICTSRSPKCDICPFSKICKEHGIMGS